jgi:hypothetical protein
LVGKAYAITGTFKECAKEYLDYVYKLEYQNDLSEEDRDILSEQAVEDIMDSIGKNEKNYNEYELFKMQELYRTINNRYSIKYIKDSDEYGLLAAAKKAAAAVLDKKGQFLFNRHIEDLQRGWLEPIKYEELSALYENEELLIAYFRMVNYVLMNYPDAIGKNAYNEFVLNFKKLPFAILTNNKVLYAELLGVYIKDFLSVNRDSLFDYVQGNGYDYDTISIFEDFNKEIRNNKHNKDMYHKKLFNF